MASANCANPPLCRSRAPVGGQTGSGNCGNCGNYGDLVEEGTMSKQYNRKAEDLGNIVGLEHVNLQVENQVQTTLFYISGLGLTRDPYLMTSVDNMWVN